MPTLTARRKDRQVGEEEALNLITAAEFGHLATITEDGYPYVIPVNHAVDGRRLLIHSAAQGEKVSNIERDPRVSFEVSRMIELVAGDVPCRYSAKYESAVCFGKAKIVRDTEAKRHALTIISQKYSGMGGPFEDSELARVVIIEVQIEAATCKIRK